MIRSSDCFAIVHDCILVIVKPYKIAKVCVSICSSTLLHSGVIRPSDLRVHDDVYTQFVSSWGIFSGPGWLSKMGE
jgi:hypothetical protein